MIKIDPAKLQESSPLPVLGAVPWSFDLIATRAIDMARHLNATIINEGDIKTRRVKSVTSARVVFRICWNISAQARC
ncbi:phosphate acetyltransferase [Salmonella enterica subsp. enterica]|uniref:Phosphate acetyltransferase n=1 Tax=Salmonella enterica I TaxID=59201 RepID=A0A379W5Q6_SALET|nr:phosphate acetyltransferase [Salmonella enterica subsp. enterica]